MNIIAKRCCVAVAFCLGALTSAYAQNERLAIQQLELGIAYWYGRGVVQDYAEAMKWLRLAAEAGNSEAQRGLGNAYWSGEGVEQDYRQAVEWYRRSSESGNRAAQTSLGTAFHLGRGVKTDFVKAVEWYRLAAEAGYPLGMHRLGIAYYYGHGVENDLSEAVKWNRLAAAAGLKEAQTFLGFAYTYGHGAEQNYAVGNKLYQRAAENGDAIAQRHLGSAHYYGRGVEQNYITGLMWWSVSASMGDSRSIDLLAETQPRLKAEVLENIHRLAARCIAAQFKNCAQVSSISDEPRRALRAYNRQNNVNPYPHDKMSYSYRAAVAGDVDAQRALGSAYYYGIGVQQDYLTGLMWWSTSASLGDVLSSELLAQVRPRLRDETIENVMRWAERCVGSNFQNCSTS